jgi:hypothetical protein
MGLITRKKGEVPSQWAELQQLEEMAGEMIVTAFKLSPGVERHDSLILIDRFRKRIAGMKRSGLEAAPAESSSRRKA